MARLLLRSSSLVVAAGILYVTGERRLHLHDFTAFIIVVLVLAIAIVGVFMATREAPRAR